MRLTWVGIDVAAIVVFVAIGRSNHHHAITLSGMASTTWPFALALGVGWCIVVARGHMGSSLGSGVVIWLCTVSIAMILRWLVNQGIAFAFILVALGFLGALMLGWRSVGIVRQRRR